MTRRGFSLIELSIVLIIAGLMAGVFLQFKESAGPSDSIGATKAQLAQIDKAVLAYVAKNDRFPRPAMRTAGVEDALYGREVPLANIGLIDTDSSGKVLFGALPFQELGLSPSFAGDAWGNKFTYVVTKDLTDAALFGKAPPNDVKEEITVATGVGTTNPQKVAYAVISHGLNSLGAVKTSYRDASATPDRKWCAAGTQIERKNCNVSATIAAAGFNDGKSAGDATFDDVLVFSGKPKRAFNGECGTALHVCAKGISTAATGTAACGTTGTWNCMGSAGGTDAIGCSFTNPACLNCAPQTVNWGAGCMGTLTTTTLHTTTSSLITNTNPSYTNSSTASATCNNGVLTTSGTCTPTPPPIPGACNNASPLSCSSGSASNDNGQTACGTTRTWHCDGTNGGAAATNCSYTNAPCSPCTAISMAWGGGCVATFPDTAHATSSAMVTNSNPSYTGTASAVCSNGSFGLPSGSCNPVVPEPGSCSTATPGACVAGDAANDNGATACGTTRTWDCLGRNTGANASCTKTNDACGCAARTENWSVGANSCSGDTPAMSDSQSPITVTNTTGGYTGSVTMSCTNGTLTQSGASCSSAAPSCSSFSAYIQYDLIDETIGDLCGDSLAPYRFGDPFPFGGGQGWCGNTWLPSGSSVSVANNNCQFSPQPIQWTHNGGATWYQAIAPQMNNGGSSNVSANVGGVTSTVRVTCTNGLLTIICNN